MDPSLREYYRHVRLVVSGPIFDWKRLRTMVNLELGRYDHLLEQWRISRGDHDAGPKEVSDDEGEEDE